MACRPFDQKRDGFIFGEGCAALVVERRGINPRAGISAYGVLSGWGIVMDGNRDPNPCFESQLCVIRKALAAAHLHAKDIDYVNPHGSGSILGDDTEVRAIVASGLRQARINTTKSITGHSLTAAGAVEIVATLLQMQSSTLHPSRNLEDPIAAECNWVTDTSVPHMIHHALNLSIGFGGVNSALCISRE